MSRLHDPDFEPRVADWLEADPDSAPAAVLSTILAALPSIQQRRAARVPWRFPTMSSFAKVAIAVIAVIAVGTVGMIALRPGGTGPVGSAPSPSPSPSLTPSPAPPSPTSTVAPTTPPLSDTFTSSMNGISISHPAGWRANQATEPWSGSFPSYLEPSGDFLYDGSLTDHLFISLASQPLAGKPADQWVNDIMASEDCLPAEPITIDGVSGLAGVDCNVAVVAIDGRGYFFLLYTSPDDPSIAERYDRAWFEQVLATVDLRPEDAVDPAASPSG